MDDLAVVDVVPVEAQAELICSLLTRAGIQCMQRPTNFSAGLGDGLPTGGPWEIVVRADQLPRAREVLERAQQG